MSNALKKRISFSGFFKRLQLGQSFVDLFSNSRTTPGLFLNILMTSFLILESCVSVKIKSDEDGASKFEQIQLIPPGSPFSASKKSLGDQAWVSSKTGNIISYFSSCNGEDPDLKALELDSVSVLEKGKIQSSNTLEYNHRQALISQIQGNVDGVEVFLEVLSFKKNNCYFTINYTGKKNHQSSEENIFKTFLKDFKVP